MSGFSFNGINCGSFGIKTRRRNRPALPATKDNYVEIPGRHGDFLFPGALQDREIVIECVLIKPTIEELRAELRNIAAWLYTEERKALEFDDEPGKFYMAKLSEEIEVSQTYNIAEFDLTFRCEPFAYGAEVAEDFVADAATVTNPGTFEALPIFTATFISVANEWKATLGAKYIRVVRDFQVDDVLEVNCDIGAVKVNGASVMVDLDWQNSEFFALPPGESDLTITPVGVCDTTVKFNPRWL